MKVRKLTLYDRATIAWGRSKWFPTRTTNEGRAFRIGYIAGIQSERARIRWTKKHALARAAQAQKDKP